jgi:hypothetical protein
MVFELPHFGREQAEADGATPVAPVDAVDQQREPLMPLLRACRPSSGGGVAQNKRRAEDGLSHKGRYVRLMRSGGGSDARVEIRL